MDDVDQPLVQNDLDPFSIILPLPFRVGIIVVIGVWAWGLNLHYLRAIKIDVPALIHYPGRSTTTIAPHHISTYGLATVLTIPLVLCLLFFWALTHGDPDLVASWQLIPNLYLLFILVACVPAVHSFSRSGRRRLLSTLKRISIGGLAEPHDGKFGDVLMADVLTSYAKVGGDLLIALCMMFTPGKSSTARPDRACGGPWLVPLIIAVPSMIRMRQCLIEYGRVRTANIKNGGVGAHGWGGQHLANALKYASAFPVVALSALMRGYDPTNIGMTGNTVFTLWCVAVAVNSCYSFWWDVTKDWDLTLFSPVKRNSGHPFGLRSNRFFHLHEVYYAVIAVDLMLRCTWSLKLSPHLYHFGDLEGGIFLMELLEVFRRWVWIFFRVETEWVRQNRTPGQEDVMLNDFQNKYEDE